MVIISMLMAMGVVLIVLMGIALLIIGIILGIIWLVKKKRKEDGTLKKGTVVLGVFSIIFLVAGLCTAVIPTVLIKGLGAVKLARYNKEISQFSDDEIAYVDHFLDIDEGFEYKGVHYAACPDDIMVPRGEKAEVGAVVFENGSHYMLYKVDFDYGEDLVCTEGGVFCPESEMDDFLNYYRNEAPLYGKVAYYDEQIYFNIESDKLDSQMIRDIRDYVTENGSNEHDELDEEFADADKTHIDFYSTDNAIWISMSFRIKDGSVDCSYDKSYAKLPKEYAEYIMEIAKKE